MWLWAEDWLVVVGALLEIVWGTDTVVLVGWLVWPMKSGRESTGADTLTNSAGLVKRLRGVVRMIKSLRRQNVPPNVRLVGFLRFGRNSYHSGRHRACRIETAIA